MTLANLFKINRLQEFVPGAEGIQLLLAAADGNSTRQSPYNHEPRKIRKVRKKPG
ncbi:MAG: hypothetical protein ACOH1I_00225 [Gallionellaceae bacterium]|jgi:hypothetical protein